MINNINATQSNSTSFKGVAKFYAYGKDVVVKQTTKVQDAQIKKFAANISPKGYLCTMLDDGVAKTFHRFLEENIFNTPLASGNQKKVISNIVGESGTKVKDYIAYGDLHTDKPGSIHFNIVF